MATDPHSEALAPTRTRQKSKSGSLKARWSSSEDQLLLQILNSGGRPNWTEIAPHFPGKTAQQISERWSKVLDPALVKGSWTRQEDEMIMEFVGQYGTKNWAKLADLLPGRIGKQCRERWRNHLDPCNNKEPWTAEEDAMLIALHEQHGNQWVRIAGIMKGRSDNHIKNRWNSTLRKRDPNLEATCETPTKRTRKAVETPPSIQQEIPTPNLDMILRTPDQATVQFGWTPQLSNYEAPSLSPNLFASPFLRQTSFSPWIRSGAGEAVFLSPRLSIADRLDLTDKE